MKIQSSRLLAVAVTAMLATAGNAYATNGYFLIGHGAGSVGMGGVGVTSPQDSLCVAANPACIGEFDRPQFDVGAALFDPRRRSGLSLGRDIDSNTWSGVNTYLLPGMGFVFPFNDELTIGFGMMGNGGAGVSYKPNFFASPGEYLGVDFVQLIIPIAASYKINKNHTLALSVIPARQRFLAQGLDEFKPFSTDQNHFTNMGHDYANGLGAQVGWVGHFLDNQVTLGATFASKIYFHKFNLYRGLFAGNGSFDAPSHFAIGIGLKPVENLTVALDVQKILYSDIPSIGNRGPIPTGTGNLPNACDPAAPVSTTNCSGTSLGGPSGSGFGWVDQTVYKLGIAYKNAFPSWFGEDKLTLRAGYNYGKTPIQEDQLLFNLLAPATSEKHYTIGATYNLADQSIFGFGSEGALTVAYQQSPTKVMSGPVIGVSGSGTASFEMYQKAIDIAYTLKF